MSRRLRGMAAALALALAGAAGAQLPAFTRTTACSNATGPALWWPGSPPSVTWTLHTGNIPPGCADLATLEALAAASFSTWSGNTCGSATSGFTFAHGAANRTTDPTFSGSDGRNLVTWRKGLCSAIGASDPCHGTKTCQDRYNCWDETGTTDPTGNILALTWVTFQTDGRILDADMELNEWNQLTGAATAGYSYTCSGPSMTTIPLCTCTPAQAGGGCPGASTSCRWADVGSIVTHEAGHVLGLDHPAGCPTTCAETMSTHISLGDTSKRVLSSQDLAGVCAIYPNGGAAVQQTLLPCDSPTPSPLSRTSKGCGCGGEPASALWTLLAPLLLLRRKRPGDRLHG